MFGKLKMLLYLATKLRYMKSKEEIQKEIKRLEGVKANSKSFNEKVSVNKKINTLYWVIND